MITYEICQDTSSCESEKNRRLARLPFHSHREEIDSISPYVSTDDSQQDVEAAAFSYAKLNGKAAPNPNSSSMKRGALVDVDIKENPSKRRK
jgi:hypothetical protein